MEPIDEASIPEHYAGKMDAICRHCGSKNFQQEAVKKEFSACCQKGKVKLDPITVSKYIETLLNGQHVKSKNFLEHIRSFNSSLAFASTGANIASPPGFGPYCFRIHGQIYHRAGALHPDEGAPRKYAQLFILDDEVASRQRMTLPENAGCDPQLMTELTAYISSNNPFTRATKMLYEVELEAQEAARLQNLPKSVIYMTITKSHEDDPRRYNAARVNEVAMIFQSEDGEPPLERDLLIHLRRDPLNPAASGTQRVSVLDPLLEAMTYPLFYPFGNPGWSPDLKHVNSNRRITQMQYYGYRFAVRDIFNPFLSAGRLTQQYFVDAYVKTEANRLNYIKLNQSKLRTEKYKCLADYVNSDANVAGVNPGKAIILPSSFQGSPRNMQQNYQDAMAVVRKYGKPDLFITMTCNPNWKEIQDSLELNQGAEHRPDIVARVFNIKLKELLEDIKKRHVLGRQKAMVHVIEFQKRGLPHAHILIILSHEDKPSTIESIDKLVHAEIPDIEIQPRLYEMVRKHMVHGPCGLQNLSSPCMENNLCSKGFPKDFATETVANLGGYPRYKRRDNGRSAKVGTKTINNQWIVPYNAFLLLKYNCHINVEVCATVKSVKYLFKYVYKGHDCANVEIREQHLVVHDEIQSFVDTRYVSPPEAAWRLCGFRMHAQTHSVSRLQVHLPEEQNVVFRPDNINAAIERAADLDTTLTGWFKLNASDPMARTYLYFEIPEYYVFKDHNWTPRKRGTAVTSMSHDTNEDAEFDDNDDEDDEDDGNSVSVKKSQSVIGRMYTVNICETERYCLRLLLLHTKGATSFDHLKTVNGITHEKFKEAAMAMGLLDDEEVWHATLNDAAIAGMPYQLRQLFALICIFASPSNIQTIWEKHRESLMEDFVYSNQHQPDCDHCINLALQDIQETLVVHGKKCDDFGLPTPTMTPFYNARNNYNPLDEELKGLEMSCNLNTEQAAAFEAVCDATMDASPSPKCFFIDGPGGSGKTYLYKTLISTMLGEGKVVLPVASTGLAANLLPSGRTYHSQYKLPVPLVENSVSSMRSISADAQILKAADLLIWDESTMAPTHALKAVDRLLKEIMQNDIPFGGKVLLLGGDFRQTLPVVLHGSRSAIVETSVKFSTHWDKFKRLTLIDNVRSQDPEYSHWLLKLGNGDTLKTDSLPDDIVEIPEHMIAKSHISEEVFGSHLASCDEVMKVSNRAILCPKNEDAYKINEQVLKVVQGEETSYLSADTIEDEGGLDSVFYPTEFLNGLHPSGMPPHDLRLKVGAIIMLLRNLNTKRGLCNGTRLIAKTLQPNIIIAQVLTGSATGQIVFIPRIQLAPVNPEIPFILRRRQFPLNLAFAMTINKSQGQTLDKVGIYLPEPVFTHGQLYVAFSRVRRACDVTVQVLDGAQQGKLLPGSEKTFTKNVVYQEVLH